MHCHIGHFSGCSRLHIWLLWRIFPHGIVFSNSTGSCFILDLLVSLRDRRGEGAVLHQAEPRAFQGAAAIGADGNIGCGAKARFMQKLNE